MVRFKLGQTVITANAQASLNTNSVYKALSSHQKGDWGDICDEDKLVNEEALKYGDRLMSVYKDSKDTVFWVITEAARSVTTVLLPEDY